jgi:hypothetical protein
MNPGTVSNTQKLREKKLFFVDVLKASFAKSRFRIRSPVVRIRIWIRAETSSGTLPYILFATNVPLSS